MGSRDYLAEVDRGLAGLADRPVLIVWGTADQAFPAGNRKRFEQAFPHHQTVILEGANHFIQEDAPGQIAAAISPFLL